MDTKNEPSLSADEQAYKELEAEGHTLEGISEASPEPAKEEPEVTSEKEPEEPVTEETPTVDRTPKEPTMIPAWKAKIAQERADKQIAELQAQIEEYQKEPTPAAKQEIKDGTNNLRELAKESGVELDENTEKFLSKLVDSSNMRELQKTVDALRHQQELAYLENEFDAEFSNDVLPLLKAEYGDLSETSLKEIKQKLHDQAFTETYARVPLKKVYRAEVDDLGIKHTEKRKTVQSANSGKGRDTSINYDDVDEDTFKSMSGDDILKYEEHMRNKNSSWR